MGAHGQPRGGIPCQYLVRDRREWCPYGGVEIHRKAFGQNFLRVLHNLYVCITSISIPKIVETTCILQSSLSVMCLLI